MRDTDPDHDGVTNDRCPRAAEDLDGFEDEDGCPDPDDDRDGVVDTSDLCPREAEDLDRFEDTDGCPDPDNDRDRTPDAQDACPDHGETWNGYADDDGCPDPMVIDYDSFTDNLFVPEVIMFDRGDAKLRDMAYLVRFANWIQGESKIEVLAVIGHIEAGEPAGLGLERANVIADVLVRAGVPRARLSVHDAGTNPAHEWAHVTRPPGADRSVHFRYFKLAGKTSYRWDGTRDVPVP
jgi:OOP family OmpA-OmpF porin